MSPEPRRYLHVLSTLGISSQSSQEPGAVFILPFVGGETTEPAAATPGPSLMAVDVNTTPD